MVTLSRMPAKEIDLSCDVKTAQCICISIKMNEILFCMLEFNRTSLDFEMPIFLQILFFSF